MLIFRLLRRHASRRRNHRRVHHLHRDRDQGRHSKAGETNQGAESSGADEDQSACSTSSTAAGGPGEAQQQEVGTNPLPRAPSRQPEIGASYSQQQNRLTVHAGPNQTGSYQRQPAVDSDGVYRVPGQPSSFGTRFVIGAGHKQWFYGPFQQAQQVAQAEVGPSGRQQTSSAPVSQQRRPVEQQQQSSALISINGKALYC